MTAIALVDCRSGLLDIRKTYTSPGVKVIGHQGIQAKNVKALSVNFALRLRMSQSLRL